MRLIQKFLAWFTDKNGKEQLKQLKETIAETPPPKLQIRTIQDVRAAVQIKTFRDVKAFCEEIRKTLTIYKHPCDQMRDVYRIHKKAIDRLYVEVGNLSDKIDRLTRQESEQQ